MSTAKELFFRTAGFGTGAGVGLSVIVMLFFWYTARAANVKPWDKNALIAVFDRVDTTEQDSKFDFEYVLENKTDRDYELTKSSAIKIAGKLEDTKSLAGFETEGEIVLKLPIFVPTHQKTRIHIIVPSYNFKPQDSMTPTSTPSEYHAHFAEVAAYVAKELSNLDGFVVFDQDARYQIEFPGEWKQIATREGKKDN